MTQPIAGYGLQPQIDRLQPQGTQAAPPQGAGLAAAAPAGLAGPRTQAVGPGKGSGYSGGVGSGPGSFQPVGPGNLQSPGSSAWGAGANGLGQSTGGWSTTGGTLPSASEAGLNTQTGQPYSPPNGGGTFNPTANQSSTPAGTPQQGINPFGTPSQDPGNPYNPNNIGGGSSNVQYGGVVGGANATASAYGQMGAAAQGQQAPNVDLSGANVYAGASGAGLGLMAQTAMGGGPAQQAATAQLQQGTSNAINAGMALANSTRGGGPAQAAAQAGAMQNAASQTQQGSMSASQLQAQMAAQAQQGFVSGAEQEQQQQYQQSMGVAGLQQAQTAQNAQIAQGYYGLGNSAEAAQLSADSNVYANNLGLAGTAMQVGAQQQSAAISAGTGASVGLLTALGTAMTAA